LSEPVAVKLAVKNRGQGRLSDRSPALAFLVAGREICRVAYHYLLQLRHLERSGSLVRCFTGLPWSSARRWLARRSTGLGRSVRKIELCARHCRIVIEAWASSRPGDQRSATRMTQWINERASASV